MKLSLLVCLAVLVGACSTSGITEYESPPSNLLVEGNEHPINVHSAHPRLSWHANVVSQSHYQIQVAALPEALKANVPDLWNSGKVESRRSVNVEYHGEKLTANQSVYWRVRVWQTGQMHPGPWSEIGEWEMGLLSRADWKAEWIQTPSPSIAAKTENLGRWMSLAGSIEHANGKVTQKAMQKLEQQPTASLFFHRFKVENPIVRAKLHSTAGGYYDVYLNGRKIADRIMDPGQTDFDKRILYNSDVVTDFVESGSNSVSVHLGSGWYDENIAFSKPDKHLSYGQPKFILQLELQYADGTTQYIVSNNDWLTYPSPVLKEGIFSGEFYDARQELHGWRSINGPNNLSDWKPVQVLSDWPTQRLDPQLLPPVKAVKTLRPKRLLNPRQGVWVYDFGQNFTGIPTLHVGKLGLNPGQAVFLRYAEWAFPNGDISQLSGGGTATHLNQVDAYVAAAGQQDSWTPQFTWHGFRYVEITGIESAPSLDALTASLVRSDVQRVGSFESSDPHLNRIHETALWTYESNLVSVPMDCPIREKGGWTGDAHAALITANYNWDMNTFWQKYLGDFQTATYTAPAIVPGKRTHGGTLDWAVAEVFIAWENYRHYGDKQTLDSQYESLIEYMDFGETQLTNYLLSKGYGDWCDPVRQPGTPRVGGRGTPQHTSTTVTSSALFAQAARHMTRIAAILGKQKDEKRFGDLYKNISQHFHAELYDPKTGHYGSQTADAMALRFGITPPHLRQSVADALNKDVIENWGGHYSVGALGQTWLYRALSDYGYGDTAFNIFKAEGYPGYGYLFNVLDGTTLWERKGAFDPRLGKAPVRSLNHPFHSGYDGWFYEGLGGIRPLENSVAYQDFELRPVFPDNLESVDVSYTTGYGEIKSSWRRDGDTVRWNITIPNNSTALVRLPDMEPVLHQPGTYSLQVNLDNQRDLSH